MNKINNQNDLLDMLETRFKTVMIGALSRFENSFGYLWKHGDDPQTQNEKLFADKWDELRIDLLNHGNNQIRLALADTVDFFRKTNRYQYNYKFIMKQGEDNE